jgi:hypothetical protein
MPLPDNNPPPRKYTWPWIALAFVILGIVLAVFWVALAAKQVRERRDYSAPLPTNAPVR